MTFKFISAHVFLSEIEKTINMSDFYYRVLAKIKKSLRSTDSIDDVIKVAKRITKRNDE